MKKLASLFVVFVLAFTFALPSYATFIFDQNGMAHPLLMKTKLFVEKDGKLVKVKTGTYQLSNGKTIEVYRGWVVRAD